MGGLAHALAAIRNGIGLVVQAPRCSFQAIRDANASLNDRRNGPPTEVIALLANLAGDIVQGGFDRIADFLTRVYARIVIHGASIV
jgi:hypothetical protein